MGGCATPAEIEPETNPTFSKQPRTPLCSVLENENPFQSKLREKSLILKVFVHRRYQDHPNDLEKYNMKVLNLATGFLVIHPPDIGWKIEFEATWDPKWADIELQAVTKSKISSKRSPRESQPNPIPLLYVIFITKLTKKMRLYGRPWASDQEVVYTPQTDFRNTILDIVFRFPVLEHSFEDLLKRETQGLGSILQATLKMYHHPACLQESENLIFEAANHQWPHDFILFLAEHGAQFPAWKT